MPDAVLYCRVSTRHQAEEGTSLDSQRDACLKHAEEKGYPATPFTSLSLPRSATRQAQNSSSSLSRWTRRRKVS